MQWRQQRAGEGDSHRRPRSHTAGDEPQNGNKEAKAVYARRTVIAEPPFGHLKNSGLRGFSDWGKEKVVGEFFLVCSAYNFKKIAKSVSTGSIRLEEAKILKIAA